MRSHLCSSSTYLPPRSGSGSAMIITLALLVLLTVTMVAFFSRTAANRQVENVTTSGVRTEILARGALEALMGDLQAEIKAGSSATTNSGVTIYNPVNNQRMVPQVVTNTTVPPYTTVLPDFANLIKQSVPSRGTFNAGGGLDTTKAAPVIRGSSSVRTDTPSRNGRFISPERWNAPQLLGGNGFSTDQLPYWIHLNATGVAADQSSTTGVIGRFAYNVYDVGGLLDVNVAGFAPTGGNGIPDEMRYKGAATWADLRSLPGIDSSAFNNSPNWLPKWRNVGDWATFGISPPGSAYEFYHRTGWLRPFVVGPTATNDRMFSSRQDLINYARMNNTMFTSPDATRSRLPALQYLTSFSRAIEAPSFAPHPDRPRIVALSSGGNDAFREDDEINPNLTAIRVGTGFTRPDGTEAVPGEPLLKRRFPLARLANVIRTATAPKDQTNLIYRSFGLHRTTGAPKWTYDHGTPSNILRLDAVATARREPDMLELLKAVITAGSLGKASGIATLAPSGPDVPRNSYDSSLNYQVVQIAANIIDQYDADGYPTVITFDGRDFYGVENLPYLSAIRTSQAVMSSVSAAHPPLKNLSLFYQAEFWNPHASTNPATTQPTEFRVFARGQATINYRQFTTPTYNYYTSVALSRFNSTLLFNATATDFRQPAYLRPGFGTAASGNSGAITAENGKQYLGMFMGNVPFDVPEPWAYGNGLRFLGVEPGMTIEVQYKAGTDWVTYDILPNYVCDFGYVSYPENTFNSRRRIDPRTNRFGMYGGLNDGPSDENKTNSEMDGINWPHDSSAPPAETGKSIWSSTAFGSAGNGESGWIWQKSTPDIGLGRFSSPYPDENLGWRPGKKTHPLFWDRGWWMGTLSRNVENADYVRYTDPDRVLRRADGAFADMLTGDGLPTLTGNAPSRPIILNRPFRSVAELGYVSRGAPWKSLDFFTPESGDAGLLDVFCILEPPPDAINAGRINLNTRQWPVLKALLQGGAILEDGSAFLDEARAESIAKTLVERTVSATANKGPLLNRADLVGRYNGTAYNGFSEDFAPLLAPRDAAIKARREAVVRSLSTAGTTRAWNFLIDVFAQTGKPSASSLQDFQVEGETRVWLHVAIDRFTGEIIARSYENIDQ